MQKILKDLKNPLDIQGFKNLLNMLMNSSTGREFYSKVVACCQDRSMEGKGGVVKRMPDEFVTFDSMGHWEKVEYFIDFFPTEHRIYINSSLETTKLLVELFINECINENIPFELKYATEAHNRADGIVIGANTKAYKKHIDILRGIAKENPELISECGTPQILTSELDGWMGLADENVSDRGISYTESRIGVILSACTKYLLKHPELENQVEGYNNMYKSYKSWSATAENLADMRIERGKLSDSQREKFIRNEITKNLADILLESEFRINYADLGKVVNENSNEAIRELYQIFLENCEILGINPNMPTQYDTSQRDLLQVEETGTIDKKINVEDKNYIDLINEYLVNSNEELKVPELISVLRTLDEKMLSEIQLMGKSLMDASLLTNDVKNIGGKLVEVCNSYMRDGKNSRKEKSIDSEILANRIGLDSNTLEKIKGKNFLYFSQPLEPIENMKKNLAILQTMREKHNIASPQLKNRNLETKIEFLEFMVEHYDEIAECFLQISNKLETLSKDEIESLAKKFYIEKRPTEVQFRRTLKKRRIAEGVVSIEEKREKKVQEDFGADLE